MLASSPALDSLLDRARQFVIDAYDRMQSDWMATAYWAGVWACGFIVTFLLIRMMFTHWGDRDVTKKTIWFSLLVHTLVGMLSTTVIFPNVRGEPGLGGSAPIRHVIIQRDQGDSAVGDEDLSSELGHSLERSPAWEQAPRFEGQNPRRSDMSREPAADKVVLEKQPSKSEPLPLPAPDLAEHTERDEPVPQADRDAAKMNPRVELDTPQIAEETADSRPEAGAGSTRATRQSRGNSAPAAADIGRPARTTQPADVSVSVEAARDLPDSAIPDEAAMPAAERADPAASRRIVRGAPGAADVDDAAGLEEGQAGTSPSGRKFSRMGRPSAPAAGPEGSLRGPPGQRSSRELTNLSPGSSAAGSIGGPGSPGRDGAGDLLIPEILGSDAGGAINKNGGKVPATYRLRNAPGRKKFAIDMGANEESEKAVEASLEWLAAHQHARGYWEPIESTLGVEPENTAKFTNLAERQRSGFYSQTGLTALAVLAFLGKGYTHEDNQYAETVDRALGWLVSQQEANGFLGGRSNQYARMYCHGMATIALGEAYGMTKDPALREPLSRAIDFIVSQQYPDGSWRYTDWRRLTVREGDMSMFGWQLMALKSARTAGLAVPDGTMKRAIDFLIAQGDHLKSRGLSQHGGLAAYRLAERPKPSMTAEALFCKQMLGIKRTNRASAEAVDYLLENLPQRSKQDLYYWYYGTLAMYHHGGEAWRRWNEAMRDTLVADQRTDGDFSGSWNPRAPWGDYGGRVFSTALATLSLEVYYRFLPLYQLPGGARIESE
jgi:hypothetical protein